MESAGHVDQKRSDVDGRAREIELTAKGIRLARQVEEGSRERFTRILAAIPAKQRGQVVGAIEILNAALQTLEVPS
jgi:DNA-binding MarR family transcriptional regulator